MRKFFNVFFRLSQFRNIVADLGEDSCNLKTLCPTRWTVRVSSLLSVLKHYASILELLSSLGDVNDKISTTARGLQSHFVKSETLFVIKMCISAFTPCDNFAKYLQCKDITVGGALLNSERICAELMTLSSESNFDELWNGIESDLEKFNLIGMELPRKRRRPTKFAGALPPPTSFNSVRDYYHDVYSRCFLSLRDEIMARFCQPGLREYSQLETILLKETFSPESYDLCRKYELCGEDVKLQLSSFRKLSPKVTTIDAAATKFRALSNDTQLLLPELKELLRTLLVIPSSAASAERSFSMVRRLKTYLRNSLTQAHLNHLSVLTVHKNEVDALDDAFIIKEFVNSNSYRVLQFGKC